MSENTRTRTLSNPVEMISKNFRASIIFGKMSWAPEASKILGFTQFLILLCVIWSMMLVAGGFQAAKYIPDYKWTGVGVFFFGAFLLVASVVGSLAFCGSRTTRLLLFYSSLMLVAALGLSFLAGAAFFYRTQVSQYIEDNWDEAVDIGWPGDYSGVLSAKFGTDADKRRVMQLAENYMIMTAVGSWTCVLVLWGALRHVADVVNWRRATENFLETMNMCLLPLGLICVMGGQYITDTSALVSAPITSFVLSISGVLLMAISFVGCFGTAIDSRGVLRVYSWLNFVLATSLFFLGIVTFAVRDDWNRWIINNWESIRLVLPPTFEGKYDRNRFIIMVEAHYNLTGYFTMVFGVVLWFQYYCAVLLRASLKQQEQRDSRADSVVESDVLPSQTQQRPGLNRGESMRFGNVVLNLPQSPTKMLKDQWREQYKQGTARQRRVIKMAGCMCCVVLFVVMVVICVAMVFSTQCDQLDRKIEKQTYDYQDRADMQLINNYNTGPTTVKLALPDTQGLSGGSMYSVIETDERALKLEQINKESALFECRPGSCKEKLTEQSKIAASSGRFTLTPAKPEEIMGLDVTCQLGSIDVSLPSDPALQVAITDSSRISTYDPAHPKLHLDTRDEIRVQGLSASAGQNASRAVERMQLYSVNATSHNGHVTFEHVSLGVGGGSVLSHAGDIKLEDLLIGGGTTDISNLNTEFELTSKLGQIELSKASVYDCAMRLNAVTSKIELTDVNFASVHGSSPVIARNNKGSVNFKKVSASMIDVATLEGKIDFHDVSVNSNNLRLGQMRVSAEKGNILLKHVKVDGNLFIESNGGTVTVQLGGGSRFGSSFVGYFELRSQGRGTITMRRGIASQDDFITFDQTSSDQVLESKSQMISGRANCGIEDGIDDCPVVGTMIITSLGKGNIVVVIGCDRYDECPEQTTMSGFNTTSNSKQQ